jgi:hypothetical protein
MFEHDFAVFAQLMDDTWAVNPKWTTLIPTGKAVYFKALECYPIAVVEAALMAHVRDPQRGRYQPTPADLVFQIEAAQSGTRPAVDEAWALSLAALDEGDTVVWTEEMRDAFTLCRPLLVAGDKIGARMAFKDAYARLLADAMRQHKPVKWDVSLGTDPRRRKDAITRAECAGLLPAARSQALLPAPIRNEEVDRAGLARLKTEVAKLVPADEKLAQRREAQLNAERKSVEAQKRAIENRVREYSSAHHTVLHRFREST